MGIAVLWDESHFTDLFRKRVRNQYSKTSKGLTRRCACLFSAELVASLPDWPCCADGIAVLEDENHFTDLFRKRVRNQYSKTSKGLTRRCACLSQLSLSHRCRIGLVALMGIAVLEDENHFTDLFRKRVRNQYSKTSKGLTRRCACLFSAELVASLPDWPCCADGHSCLGG